MSRIYLFILFLIAPYVTFSQQSTSIWGRVTNTEGHSLGGVTVTLHLTENKVNTALTDESGFYTIPWVSGAYRLSFSHIGMKTIVERVNEPQMMNVVMEYEGVTIDSVVVTALGIRREARALNYSRQAMDISTMTEAPANNMADYLQGKIAGVQITPSNTNTGSARIVIRGNNSITGNNQPLFVIDGVPVDNSPGDGNVTTSGNTNLDYGNIMGNINPEDIESVEILKGPNAAALYGSRAANGAILVTTKKSLASRFKVTINSNATFQRITEFYDYQDMFGAGNSFRLEGSGSTNNPERIPDLRVFYRSWGPPMIGQPVISINGQPKEYLPQPDNVRDFYQTAGRFTNSLAVEGGNSANNYRFSYSNFTGGSVVAGINKNTRHNLNLRALNKFNKWLDFDTRVTFINNKVNNRQAMNGSTQNPIYQYAYMVRDDQLSEFKDYKDAYGNEINTHRDFLNPYWAINENPNSDTRNQLLGAFNLNAKINRWLKFTAKLGTEMHWHNGFTFNNKGAQALPNGSMSTFNNTTQSSNTDLIVFANNRIGDISINSFVGGGRFKLSNTRNRQSINALIQPGLINLSNSAEAPMVSQFESQKMIYSLYGSTSFGFKNFLYTDITARNDWSSTLPIQNNSYFYPSFGGSFIFTDAFKLPKNILTFGKLRGSYAIVGNDTDPYQLIPTYSFGSIIYNNQNFATLSSTFYNPDLKPERTRSLEYGIDLRFFHDRLGLSYTRYRTSTTDQIITAQVTPASGYTRRFYNAGEIMNLGNEFTLTAAPVKSKDFSWNIITNYANNQSEVKSLVEGVNSFQLNTWFGRLLILAEIGEPYGVIKGAAWKRDEQGRKLVNSGGLPIADPAQVLGHALPDWTGSVSNAFKFKNFGLSFLVDVRKGGAFYSGTYRRSYISGAIAATMPGREEYFLHNVIYGESGNGLRNGFIYADAYFEDGSPNNKFISPQSNGFANIDEMQVFDASYVRLREAVLNYTLPAKLLQKSFISNASVALSGRNLWTIFKNAPRGIDPESSVTSGNGQGIEYGQLPPVSTYGFDIRLTF